MPPIPSPYAASQRKVFGISATFVPPDQFFIFSDIYYSGEILVSTVSSSSFSDIDPSDSIWLHSSMSPPLSFAPNVVANVQNSVSEIYFLTTSWIFLSNYSTHAPLLLFDSVSLSPLPQPPLVVNLQPIFISSFSSLFLFPKFRSEILFFEFNIFQSLWTTVYTPSIDPELTVLSVATFQDLLLISSDTGFFIYNISTSSFYNPPSTSTSPIPTTTLPITTTSSPIISTSTLITSPSSSTILPSSSTSLLLSTTSSTSSSPIISMSTSTSLPSPSTILPASSTTTSSSPTAPSSNPPLLFESVARIQFPAFLFQPFASFPELYMFLVTQEEGWMYAIVYTGDRFSYQLVKSQNWLSLEPTWEILLEFNTRPVNMICSNSAKLIFLQPAPNSLIKFTHMGQVFSDLQLLKLVDDEIFNVVLSDNTISSFFIST